MKRMIFSLVLALLFGFWGYGQDSDVAALSIRVQQPEREYLTAPACRLLQTKMTQILNQNGVVNDIPSNRFVMTAKANVLNKDIIAGSPSRISEQIEMIFIIGDVIDNKKYGSYVLNLTGVGLNEQQAIQMAIKSIKNNDAGMHAFIEQSKTRIVQYYRDNEAKILLDADKLVSQGLFDEAVYALSLIPDACGECYAHCQERMVEINQLKIDEDGKALLTKAKAAWAKSPNAQGAKSVYPIITAISPHASCYKEVTPFLKQITSKLVADEKREWEFKVQQYEDAKAREQRDFEQRVKEYEDSKAREQRNFEAQQAREARNAALMQQEIAAARDVAMEYAKNQPETVYYESNDIILLW